MSMRLPFAWSQFDRETGSNLPPEAKRRITRCVNQPTAETWAAARTLVVAPKLSYMGQTLWQCVEAVTLRPWPDGDVPAGRDVVMGLCYAAGLPFPTRR